MSEPMEQDVTGPHAEADLNMPSNQVGSKQQPETNGQVVNESPKAINQQQNQQGIQHYDGPFGAALQPVLVDACDGELTDISWFRTDWQRGGAATAYAKLKSGEAQVEVVVKMPIPPGELAWLNRLQHVEDVAPKVYASGATLGGYDIAWVVMEKLPHGPIGSAWGGAAFDLTVDAIGRFYAAASEVPNDGAVKPKDYDDFLKRARENVKRHSLPEEQRWHAALKRAHKKLPKWLDIWKDRATNHWLHGDLHLANAMTRVPAPDGPALLFDYAETRCGHWVTDAVYLEHQYWGRKERLEGRKICSMIAKARKKHGLSVEADWPQLAEVKRALLAMCTPVAIHRVADANHVHAALEMLEIAVS